MAQPQQPPPPLPKPGWGRMPMPSNNYQPSQQQQQQQQQEEAIPSDSLYDPNASGTWGGKQQQQQQYGSTTRPSLTNSNLAHWSSHGYLSKEQSPASSNRQSMENGYVLLKRQGDQMVPVQQSQQQQMMNSQTLQPQSLPSFQSHQQQQLLRQQQSNTLNGMAIPDPPDRKYFSVRGFSDFRSKHNNNNSGQQQQPPQNFNQQQPQQQQNGADFNKYFSVDARYNSVKNNLPPDLRQKLRQVQEAHNQQRNGVTFNLPNQPAPPPPPRPASNQPQAPPRPSQQVQQQQQPQSSLERSKQMSGSVSWLEWTQQLQAYIAWVNSQLRKRPDLKPVQDLRTDLQSGEVLAQLIEIICKYFSCFYGSNEKRKRCL